MRSHSCRARSESQGGGAGSSRYGLGSWGMSQSARVPKRTFSEVRRGLRPRIPVLSRCTHSRILSSNVCAFRVG